LIQKPEVIYISIHLDSAQRAVIEKIGADEGIVMVIGRVDTGKSTFCRQLASAAVKRGLKASIVDSDVGQSWIGPPTTVGMKVFTDNLSSTFFPDSFYFVGNTSPERHLLQTIVGVKLMVESAQTAGAQLVIVDTTGLVDGQIGRILKESKIDLIKPDHIVCLQRNTELEILIKGIEVANSSQIHRLKPSKYVKKKTQNNRRSYREGQFERYFSQFVSHEFKFSQLHGQRTPFLNGRMANNSELENLSEIIEDRVLYAEWSYKAIFMVTVNNMSRFNRTKLCNYFSLNNISWHTPRDFDHLLTALVNEHGESICLAVIENIDFCQHLMTLKCSKDSGLAKAIQFSRFHLSNSQ
jgi:polynucleotide 5'-hydroxyl-kinase GRC3/NOL9